MDEHRQEFHTAVDEATGHLGTEETNRILFVAGAPDTETLLDFTLTMLTNLNVTTQ